MEPITRTLRFAFLSLRLMPLPSGRNRMVTKRQKEMLDYLQAFIAEHGYAPTLDEIGQHFSLASLATVHKHLGNLEVKRFIRRLRHESRARQVNAGERAS